MSDICCYARIFHIVVFCRSVREGGSLRASENVGCIVRALGALGDQLLEPGVPMEIQGARQADLYWTSARGSFPAQDALAR